MSEFLKNTSNERSNGSVEGFQENAHSVSGEDVFKVPEKVGNLNWRKEINANLNKSTIAEGIGGGFAVFNNEENYESHPFKNGEAAEAVEEFRRRMHGAMGRVALEAYRKAA